MDNQSWQELDQYEQDRILNQKMKIKDNTIKDLKHEVDFLRRVNDDVLKENYALRLQEVHLERQAVRRSAEIPNYGVQTVLIEKLGLLKEELLKLTADLKRLQQD